MLAQPGIETEDDLAGVLAERVLGDKTRHLEMAWWAEVKRKDWALHGERPVMPFAVMKAYAASEAPGDDRAEMGLPSAGSGDPRPHEAAEGSGAHVGVVKEEPCEEMPKIPGEEQGNAKKRRLEAAAAQQSELAGLKAPTTLAGTPAARAMGPVVAPPKARARGSAAKALVVAASEDLMRQAKVNYGELVYAKSTASQRE